MDFRFYDFVLNIESFFILGLCIAFIVFYFSSSLVVVSSESSESAWTSFPIKKIAIMFVVALGVGALVLCDSWWEYHGLLCLSLIVMFSTSFMHDSFLISNFVFLLFLRPWELIIENSKIQSGSAEGHNLGTNSELVSIPKLWLFLLISNFFIGFSKREKYFFRWMILDTLVGLFMLWMVIPLLIAGKMENLKEYFDTLFSAGVIYFFIRLHLRNEFSYRALAKGTVFIGYFLLLITFGQFYFSRGLSGSSQRAEAFGLFENSNDLAALIVYSLPFVVCNIKNKLMSSLVIILAFLAVYITQSRGGFVGVFVGLTIYFFITTKFRIPSVKKAIPLILVFSFIFKIFVSSLNREQTDLHDSTWGRFNYWIAAIRMVFYNPIAGVGFGNYPKNFERYTMEFLEFGERTAHSSFFLVLAEGGLVGIFIYLMIFKTVFQMMLVIRNKRPELVASFCGYGITMVFLSHSYLFFSYILLAMIGAEYESFCRKDPNVSVSGTMIRQ